MSYLHGHHESVLAGHRWRTVENSAEYLLEELSPGMDLLDVGCGPGTITAGLADLLQPGKVTGLDAAEEVIGQARRDHAPSRSNLSFQVGDAYRLDFSDGAFDVVHAHQLLQHLSDPRAALAEMRRVAKAGGLVAVREADYGAMTWFPANERLETWRQLYRELARASGGEPDAGRALLSWAQGAGFSSVAGSAAIWCFANPVDRDWWGGHWAARVTDSRFAEQALSSGMASRADLEDLAEGWRHWLNSPDGWFAVPHGQVLCRV